MADTPGNKIQSEKVADVLAFLVIKKLVMKIGNTDAFKLGLVDNQGKIIKQPETDEEKSSLTLLDKVMFKLKRMLSGKIAQLNGFLYVQTLGQNVLNNIVIKGGIDQRASIKRIKQDIGKLAEKHNCSVDDIVSALIFEEVHEDSLITESMTGLLPEVAGQIQSFSKRSGKSEEEVERLWNKAKDIVKDQYPELDDKDNGFWKLVVGVLKKMLKIDTEAANVTTTSAQVGPGQSGAYKKRMLSPGPKEVKDDEKKRKKVLSQIQKYLG